MPPMGDASEKLFQDQVVQLARVCGWLTFHAVPHQVRPGVWRSDGRGFPDLVLVHPRHGVLFAELKTLKGRMTPDQVKWQQNILASGHQYHLWRPNDLERIAALLSGSN